MSKFTLLPQLWASALSLEDYVERMQTHQADMRRRLATVTLSEADRAALVSATHIRYALAMTEDWCGDAVCNLPIVARIVEALPQAELRLVYRSDQDHLNAHYQTRDIAHVPVLTFFDESLEEIGTWFQRPRAADRQFEAWKAARPTFLKIRYDPALDPEDRKRQLAPFYAQLIQDMFDWYEGDLNLQRATIDEIFDLLGVPHPVAQEEMRRNG